MTTNTQDNRGNGNRNAQWNYYDGCTFGAEEVKKLPSVLAIIIPEIANIIFSLDIEEKPESLIPVKVEEKIDFNCVVKYKEILKELGHFLEPIDTYLNLLNEKSPRQKTSFLRRISSIYRDTLFELNIDKENKMDFIRNNSDKIIDAIADKLYNLYIQSANSNKEIYEESIILSIQVILCKLFVDCKILENPLNY